MAETTSPSPDRARPRRWLRVLLAMLVLGAALLAGGVAWLARSDGGSAWLLARVPGLAATGTQGSLAGGPFRAERIELKLGLRMLVVNGLAWQDARWRWRPHDGAWIGLTMEALRAERVEVSGPASAEPLALPVSLRLPIALLLPDARIGALHLEGQAPLTQIAISAELGARAGAEHRVSQLAFVWDRTRAQGRAAIASDAPFSLDVQAEARSLDGAARPWLAGLTARGPLQTLALQAQIGSDAAPGAMLRAEATVQPFAAWPLSALAATMQDLDLAHLGSGLPATRLSGRVDIDTRGLDAPVSARLAVANASPGRWDQQRLPFTALELELSGHPRQRERLDVQRLAIQLIERAGRIEGSGHWHGDTAELALRLHGVRPALLDARAPAMTLGGTTSMQLGGLAAPDGSRGPAATQRLQARLAIEGRLDARSALPVQIGAQVQAERSGAAWRIDLKELDARNGTARAQATLAAERSSDGSWRIRSAGELAGIEPALWFPGAADSAWRRGPHRLAGSWKADLQAAAAPASARQIEARLLALRGNAEFVLRDSLLAGVPLEGSLRLDGRTPGWGVDAALHAGANHATLQGRLAPHAEDDRWRIELEAPALAALQPLIALHPAAAAALRGPDGGLALAGRIASQLQGEGRWPAMRANGTMRATALQAGALRAARVQAQAQAGPDAAAPLALHLDGEQLALGALRADTLQARIDGSLAEHRVAIDLLTPLRPPAWADALLGAPASGTRLQSRSRGRWQPGDARDGPLAGRWLAQAIELDVGALVASTGTASANGPAWLRARELNAQLQFDADGHLLAASAEPGRAELLGAALRWHQAQWRAGAGTAKGEATLDAELEPLALAPGLGRLQPAAGLGGNLTLAGHARVSIGAQFSADVVLERHSGDLTLTDDTGTTAFGLTDLRFALAAQDGTWHFTQALAGGNLGVLAGAQSLRLTADARWPRPDTPMEGVLEWRIADLGAWTPFTPPGWRLSGMLRTGAALGGTFGSPQITGEMNGSRLALRNLLQGVDVRDGELALSLRGSEATIDRFVFKGGAGELRLTGGASLGAEPRARLQLTAERFKLLGRIDRRIVASGDATLLLAPQSLALDGGFRIDEGLIDFSRSDAPSLDSDVQVRSGRAAAPESAASAAAPGASAASSGTPRTQRIALQIDLGQDLKIRGHGLDTQLRGNLALSAPNGRLAIAGSVRTEAGSYAAYGQKLTIERGVLTFNGPADDPRLDILALRPNLDQRVGVLVSGSAQAPRVRLYSEPEMSDSDKLSWLVLGRAPDGLASTDTALLQRAALALLAGEGQGLDSTLLSNIGLDELSVRQNETGDVRNTVVSVGKQLSRRWYVGYERSVNSTTGSWQVIYRVAQRFTLRAQSGEDNALDAIWTWRWN
jgi:translocation and assembly module TamB